MLQVKISNPNRPPRVILLGPPGSGKSHQANMLSDRFGLINISAREVLESEIAKKTKNSLAIKEALDKGELISDDIIIPLIEKRI